MKNNYILLLLLAVVVMTACDSEEPKIIAPQAQIGSFLDERDGNEYKTITVGGQTWMAENLRYRLALGPVDGSATFNEVVPDTSDVTVDMEVMRTAMLEEEPNMAKFGQPWTFPWMYTDMLFFGGQMTYTEFKTDVLPMFDTGYLEFFTRHYDTARNNALADFTAQNTDFSYAEKYGYLYSYAAALKAVPAGWRLPTDEDWKKLEATLGMSAAEIDRLEDWRGTKQGLFLKRGEEGIGFDALMPGGRVDGVFEYTSNYKNLEFKTYYWTSTTNVLNDSTTFGINRALQYNLPTIYRGTTSLVGTQYSVRCIKN